MLSIDRVTGRTINGWDVYAQRVVDVVTTSLQERIKRRQMGSKLPSLIGRNLSDSNKMLARAYVALAYYNPNNQINNDAALLTIDVETQQSGFLVIMTFNYQGEIKRVSTEF